MMVLQIPIALEMEPEARIINKKEIGGVIACSRQ